MFLLSVHIARYVADDGQPLFIVQAGTSADSLGSGIECAITWALPR
jgi:hypothetical protein